MNAPKIAPSELSQFRFGSTDKATKYHAMARDAALSFGSFAIGTSSETYEPVLLRVAPDQTVRIESQAAFQKMLLDLLGTYEPVGVIKREIAPLVLNTIADRLCVCLTDIKPFLFQTQSDGFTWHRLGFDPDVNAPQVPEYEAMSERTNADAFRAQTEFFGSILDYKFMIEQYLHFSGRGNDGKSTLINAIWGALPAGFGTAIAADDLSSSHGTAKIEGKRLLVFSEENNSGFMSQGKFKQVTGRDPMSINPKNQPEREIIPNCRVIVTSNKKPRVHGGAADMRRIIPIFYESFSDGILGDQHWQQRMMAKGADILKYCYAQYCKNVRDVGAQRIKPDADFLESIAEMSSSSDIKARFERLFEPTERQEVWVSPSAAVQHIKDSVRDKIEQAQLREYLHELPKFRPRTSIADTKGPRVIRGWAIRGDATLA